MLAAALGAIAGFPPVAGAVSMSWSAPITLDTGHVLEAVACPSATQCTAVDADGQQVTFNPNAPGTPTPTMIDSGKDLSEVACPSTSQCTAITGGDEVTFDPTAPGTPIPTTIDPSHGLVGVACPSTRQCTAVGNDGEVTFDPTAPGTPTPIATGGGVAVACPSTSQCTATYMGGQYGNDEGEVTFNPTTGAVTGGSYIAHNSYALNGRVACPSTSQCTAVGGDINGGRQVTFNPSTLIPTVSAITIDPGGGWIYGVACPSISQCTAVDEVGRAFEGDLTPPASWTVEPIAGSGVLDAIDCSSVMQCVAVGSGGAFVGTPARTLTVSVAGGGSGTVTASGINCPGSCSHSYGSGTIVTLTATPAAGSTFAGWAGGDCAGSGSCAVTMSSDQAVTATFTITPNQSRSLTVSLAGSGAGTVTGAGINCPGACSHSYANGTIVTLTATPKAGSTFAGWSGGRCNGTGTCTMTMTSDQAVTATFTAAGNLAVPSITRFKLTSTRFAVGPKPTAINARASATAKPHKTKSPRGSAFHYTLSEASTATIVIERQISGRLVGEKCVAQTKANAKKKRCTIPGRLVGKKCVAQTKANATKRRCTITKRAGALTRNSKAGSNAIAFSGRIGRTALRPATYQATITARVGKGPTSKPRSATFTIIRG